MTPRIDHSPEAARGLLLGLFGWAGAAGELIEVSIKSPRGKWHSQHWDVATLTDAETIKQLTWWSTQGREIYMGAVGLTGRPASEWRRGGAALRGHAGALWLDVDCEAPGREGPEFFTGVDEAVEIIDAALGPTLASASVVVGSGWGVQYWIPLDEPVLGEDASRLVRVLVGWLGEMTCKKIDRVWDLTRVMRMPGTLNWRAGPDEDEARPTGVLRWPEPSRARDGRLGLGNVIAVLGDLVTDVLGPEELEGLEGIGDGDDWAVVEWLLERYAPGGDDAGGGAADGRGSWAGLEIVGDLNRIATETLMWADVLGPYGWRQLTTGYGWPASQAKEQVWERPGKEGLHGETGERSAVVYADKPELLVVYSDSPLTGFSAGLMGSGRRGTAAGVGVITKWRAWVDLAWGGDEQAARHCVLDPDAAGRHDPVAERLGRAWRTEMDPIEEWGREREYEALRDPWTTVVVPVQRELEREP